MLRITIHLRIVNFTKTEFIISDVQSAVGGRPATIRADDRASAAEPRRRHLLPRNRYFQSSTARWRPTAARRQSGQITRATWNERTNDGHFNPRHAASIVQNVLLFTHLDYVKPLYCLRRKSRAWILYANICSIVGCAKNEGRIFWKKTWGIDTNETTIEQSIYFGEFVTFMISLRRV